MAPKSPQFWPNCASRDAPNLGAVIAATRTVPRKISNSGSIATLTPHDPYRITRSDELFFALEGRTLEAAGNRWRLEICGVHSADSQHWVQLNLRGAVSQGLTIRVRRLDARDVLTMVREWLEGVLPSSLESSVTGRSYLPVLTN